MEFPEGKFPNVNVSGTMMYFPGGNVMLNVPLASAEKLPILWPERADKMLNELATGIIRSPTPAHTSGATWTGVPLEM